MCENRLKMNNTKTEFLLFGSRKNLSKCVSQGLDVNGEWIHVSEFIKYLGVYLDRSLSMGNHIIMKCKIAMFNFQRLKQI